MRTRIPHPRTLAPGLVLAALLLAPAGGATEAPADPGATADPVREMAPAPVTDLPGVTAFAPTRRPAAGAFAARLREADERHRLERAAMRERLAAADRAGRAALQREAEALKLAHHAELLALQLERARATGRAELAARLGRRLAVLATRGATSAAARAGGAR